jgi:hypothetical protein
VAYTLLASFGLLIACVLVHYEALRVIGSATLAIRNHRRAVLVVIFGVVAAHLTEIALYASALWLGHRLGLGSLVGSVAPHATQYFFLSAETYTTLGMGDIYPYGDLRLIAALEPLWREGRIGWSGSYTYLAVQRYWVDLGGPVVAEPGTHPAARNAKCP